MDFQKNFLARRISSLCVLLLVMAACSTGNVVPVSTQGSESPEKIVVRRAQERWDALLAGNLAKAYGYISPVGRSVMSVDDYTRQVNSEYWRGAKVKDAKCEPELCVVRYDFDYEVAGVKLSRVYEEKWIVDNGMWWFVYQR
jgi:hypothetical protein